MRNKINQAKNIKIDNPVQGALAFHISRHARDRYSFDQTLFALNGNALFADFDATHEFAANMNAARNLEAYPEQAVKASDLNAMGLIDEVMHIVIVAYREQMKASILAEGLAYLVTEIGEKRLDMCLLAFGDAFPPVDVYQGHESLTRYYAGRSDGRSNREILLEEMLMLWLSNLNPAFTPFAELFDDELLKEQTAYSAITDALAVFFEDQPRFGSENQTLIGLLRAPALASSNSLQGQLDYMMAHWGAFIGDKLMRFLRGLDFMKEQNMMRGDGGAGPVELPDYMGLEEAPERFSEDKDWMPSLVLMAKNAYVWLGQLSEKYEREIVRLDQVPDEALDELADWGVTGLWLIGLWERSTASKTIKQRMGQPDAVASAYSLDDYQVAADLGGEAAMNELRRRAWQRGIRMGSDMVPNHMGMDSRWVLEHPDWFLSVDRPPFPSYTFNGPDLSLDDRVGIYLEDHYYDHSDASVVFKRVDHITGNARYIYHGNDGTSMPWNDTAQLNFLSGAVREGVIQTILHVARQFPIIRFDAAMTLAKKHIQRLWFPEPGSGGAIPSRAERGLIQAEFDKLMPEEFWREVVDRVAEEAPDTLLLAEAFWMMEGYFVRTLGMHRVYNSAFMHMLRDEDNANYRKLIKDTLEFNPQILKRYVNFMNNPDEETAIEQFGKGDKYFGVATVMATLPGLPMLGHGQIEGYAEKYGMEYRWAKWDESPNMDLVARHQQQYFPLLHARKLFAGVENFLLYDFCVGNGEVDEDVFAYSNRDGDARGLVIYLNRYRDARGWIKASALYAGEEEGILIQRDLAQGLDLPDDADTYVIFKDQVSGQEYLRSCDELHTNGLYIELHAYQAYAFVDFRIVHDSEDTPYGVLDGKLKGVGVQSVDISLQKLFLEDVHAPYRELVNKGMVTYLYDSRVEDVSEGLSTEPLRQTENKMRKLVEAINAHVMGRADGHMIAVRVRSSVVALLQLPIFTERYPKSRSRLYKQLDRWMNTRLATLSSDWGVLLAWMFSSLLGSAVVSEDVQSVSREWIDELLCSDVIVEAMAELGADDEVAKNSVDIVKLLIAHQDWSQVVAPKKKRPMIVLQRWLADDALREYIGINEFEDELWFNKERFEDWLWWAMIVSTLQIMSDGLIPDEEIPDAILAVYQVIRKLQKGSEASNYELEKFFAQLSEN